MANTKGTSVISNPQGGGAQSGIGQTFSPDLFTGTGNFSVPIALPPGRKGFQPELTLGYSTGNGNGVFGMGWALGVPGVSRKTSKGIPVYDDRTDIFILSGAEDLVPVSVTQQTVSGIGWEQTSYRPRTEGLFARIIRHKKTTGEHYWEVRSKDGLISWYGTPGSSINSASGGDPAVIANPENRNAIFSWHLTKTEDPFGNVILYDYSRELVVNPKGRSYDQLYLSKIRYAQYPDGSNTKYLCEVRFNYEARPDPFSAYKQGFETRITRRCTSIETYTHAAALIKTKTYHFRYDPQLPLNGASLLKSVEVEGHPLPGSGEPSEFMPPLEFGFSVFDPAKRELQKVTGPLPPNALSDQGFEMVDLNGNGLPDLLQLNGIARYWTNKGNGTFSPPRPMDIAPSVQLGQSGVQFFDANGDGRTDLFVNNGLLAGYFPGAFHKVWDANSFYPYKQLPSFSFADPEVQLIDLDGDGITDVLRNGAKFECFYNNPEKGFNKVRLADKTFTNFSFADPRIRFADMTGDGMQDIVLISSGRVQYWPNMGYGRFGNKVNMSKAPVFPEQYDPAQVLIGDLDGDGQADIAFVENNSVTLYVNRSGNEFSDPVKIRNTPRVTNPKALRIIDLLGTGQAGILWSFGPDSLTAGNMYFLDLTKGNKPYVLEEMNNNMGSLTRVTYGSSVYHYLRDEALPATRWKTDLPFAVQVVNKVEVFDFLSGGKLVTEYNYHDGYWDGMEREFRGFAQVDSVDTESFTQFNTPVGSSEVENLSYVTSGGVERDYLQSPVEPLYYTPPVKTKSWFNVGPVGDSFSRWHEPDFSDEYWSGDTTMLQRPADMISLLNALPRRARRDALRTLRGTLLRSELYALDGSSLESIPYTVTESMMSLREEFNPSQLATPLWNDKNAYWGGGGYVFFPFNVAQRTTQYERGTDPMHSFSFTKSYDAYGQAKGQLSVGVPRGANPRSGGNGIYLATYGDSDYIYKNIAAGQYMVNRVKRSISYDATKSALTKSVFALRDDIFANYAMLPVIGCSISYYDGNAFNGLGYGQIGNYGAQVRSETLIITDAIITEAYASDVPECYKPSPDWSDTNGYPAAFAGQLQNGDVRLGYKDRRLASPEFVPGWYAESARVKYDFQEGSLSPAEQLGLVLESRDVFDAWNSISYDAYLMMPLASFQYLKPYPNSDRSLDTSADYDYRVMQPYKVTDANENISRFDFSALGLLRATALIGKGTEGDYKGGPGSGFYDLYEPSVRMVYNFFAFKNNGDPVWVKTISREQHYAVDPLNSSTIEKVEYSDGFGRLLQTRVQAEDVIFGNEKFGSSGLPASQSDPNAPAIGTERAPGDPLNVVVSGWKIYNNKGKVVEQYEPFFDKGFDFMLPDLSGVKLKMFYDPLGRVVKTMNPDNSQQWVLYGTPANLTSPPDPVTLSGIEALINSPWFSYTYDANDLAGISHVPNNHVDPSHYFTPKSSLVDALGRTIQTTEHIDKVSPHSGNILMHYRYDIRGNLLLVKDPYYRDVFEHVYDLRSPEKGEDGKQQPLPPLWTKHIDKGISSVLFDAAGKPIESNDAKGARTLSAFDVISRPVYAWARDNNAESTTLRQFLIYGDDEHYSVIDPTHVNLLGKAYRHYDEAGLVTTPAYDFKNNLLEKQQEVILDSELLSIFVGIGPFTCYRVDWTGVPASPPAITDVPHQTNMAYDALNRITKMTYPLDLYGPLRKELIPVYNKAGALESASLDGTSYIEHIAYNAKGQRLLIAYGNGIMTRYAYDPLTFRLSRQRSESYTQSTWTFTSAGNVKQDTAYDYDLMANIRGSHERTSGCGIGGTNSLNRDFDYDAIYRVLSATGRENAPTITPIWDDSYRSTNDAITTAYKQNYAYDKLGNIQSLQHIGTGNFTRNFNYTPANNQLQSVDVGADNYAFTYDACGNQLTETSSRCWEWDATDKPRCFYVDASGSISQYTQYLYDSGGKRVKKLTWKTGGLYDSISYINGIFEYRTDGSREQNLLHIMDNRSRIAMIRIGNSFGDSMPDIQYNLEDNLGSSVMHLKDDGANLNKEEYYPFGETSFGSYAAKRYKYCAKERDNESGLYYYGARYYAAWTCRFISVDPLADKYVHITPYNYADNNPINDFDIDGQQDGNTPKTGAASLSATSTPATTATSNGSGQPNSITAKIDINQQGEASAKANNSPKLSAVSTVGTTANNSSKASVEKSKPNIAKADNLTAVSTTKINPVSNKSENLGGSITSSSSNLVNQQPAKVDTPDPEKKLLVGLSVSAGIGVAAQAVDASAGFLVHPQKGMWVGQAFFTLGTPVVDSSTVYPYINASISPQILGGYYTTPNYDASGEGRTIAGGAAVAASYSTSKDSLGNITSAVWGIGPSAGAKSFGIVKTKTWSTFIFLFVPSMRIGHI